MTFHKGVRGGAGGDRTHDQGIMSTMSRFFCQDFQACNFADLDCCGQGVTADDR